MGAKQTIRKLILAQLAIIIVAVVASYIMAGSRAAYSAFIGGGINVLATAFFARQVFSAPPGATARRVVRAFYIGEVMKILLTILLFAAVLVWLNIAPLPLFLTYAATMLASWLILPFAV